MRRIVPGPDCEGQLEPEQISRLSLGVVLSRQSIQGKQHCDALHPTVCKVDRARVVGYSWGRPLPEDRLQWAGLFNVSICDKSCLAQELQQAFDVVLCGDLLFHVRTLAVF